MDCSGSTLPGPYTYSIPTPSTLGAIMSISCPTGYMWSSVPYNGPQNAICTNVSNAGKWVISGASTCLRTFYPKCFIYFLLMLMHMQSQVFWILWLNLVDCSGSTISGSGSYTYSAPSPAPLGTTISVSCAAGKSWSSAPVYSSHSATCTNVSNTGQWVFSNGESCVGN